MGNHGRAGLRRKALWVAAALIALHGDRLAGLDDAASLLSREWHRATFGVGIGASGLHAADLDGDGRLEIVAGAGPSGSAPNDLWYVVSRSDDGGYSQSWVSLPYASPITSLAVAQVDADSALEVLVGTGTQILIHDGATRQVQQTFTVEAGPILGLTAADLDQDGMPELVFCNPSDLFVLDLAGTVRFHGVGLGGRDVAVGNVDDDPAREIVVGNGTSAGFVIDPVVFAVEWIHPAGFGDLVRLGDLDGNGRDEIVAGFASGRGIEVYDGASRSLVYSVPAPGLAALRVVDLEADGALEVIHGDAGWGNIHVLAGATGEEKWALSNPGHGITAIAVGDLDGDAGAEIAWGNNFTHADPDYLNVADAATRTLRWRNLDFSGPFHGLDFGDADADGAPELLLAADDLLFVHDGATKALEATTRLPRGEDRAGLWRVRSANVDDDPQRELFVTASLNYDALIVCYDGLTHAEQWRAHLASGHDFASLQVADLEGDGRLELVAGIEVMATAAPGIHVYVFDAATGALRGQSPSLGDGLATLSLLRVADVSGDNRPEILVADWGGRLWILDGALQAAALETADLDITALDTPDRNGDGRAEVVVGTAAGALQVLDPLTGAVVETVGTFGGPIHGLAVVDLNGDAASDYVFAREDRLRVVYGPGGPELAASERLGTGVAAHDSLLVADVDGDGRRELVVNVGEGLMVFEIAGGALASYDPRLRAPRCAGPATSCDSGSLLNGRGRVGPESHAPNTVHGACADGPSGAYHFDESADRIRVATLDGTPFAPGKTVRIEATVWAWAGYTSDKLDLYQTASAESPAWTLVATLTPRAAGSQRLTATYVLPAGAVQAVRARFRYLGSASPCGQGSYNDHDDLIFAVR